MTKRFTTEIGSIKDNKNDCFVSLDLNDLSELLNEQHETIQRLQQNITELLSVDIEKELLKENEQLKNENAKMKKELGLLAEFNQKAML